MCVCVCVCVLYVCKNIVVLFVHLSKFWMNFQISDCPFTFTDVRFRSHLLGNKIP